ncbi:MAG: glutamine--tRNA ligase/YqeY domain fusion protein [Verrucomicrobia bacterium]|jgi:glutaminyl-tRNA synthetase|nr:glutamine--tRNA ligase/YqeY domain fusion protein [Verrucomicrobiota bacterium]
MEAKDSDKPTRNFIEEIIDADLAEGRAETVVTRFPPEPNGYLHIGHAVSICLNHGLAQKYGGRFHLRFDDTNPIKEEAAYVEAIKEDVRWLGAEWGGHLHFASDYFDQLYEWAEHLIAAGDAYVDDASAEEIRELRGTLKEPGRESLCRERSPEENLDLFRRMRAGEFGNGEKTLRAKIDMAHPNLNMRDPVLYRIFHAPHHRSGDKWCLYPMYDFAHGQSDAIEGVTHSICTLEFEDHRLLYDWLIAKLPVPHTPRQIEFARLNMTYTLTSKRKLLQLVKEGHVRGWDDPRMPTLRGIRRRGYTPEALRELARRAGVAKRNKVNDLALMEFCLRKDLEERAPRRMAVLDPVKVVITNLPENARESYSGPNHPARPEMGEREVVLTREIYIERADFMEDPPKKYFRLAPGREVRLRYACYVTCTDVVKNDDGHVEEIHVEMDPESRGGSTPDGRKVKGTIHWVSATENVAFESRWYENLFLKEDPNETEEGGDFLKNLNPHSLRVGTGYGEPALAGARPEEKFQFERTGYFCIDPDTTVEKLVVNRTVGLRDTYGKKLQKG